MVINDFNWFWFRIGKKFYPQVLLEKHKYVVKDKKDAWIYYWRQISCDSDREDSVKKFPMKKILIKKIIMKKIKHRIRLFLYLKYFEWF